MKKLESIKAKAKETKDRFVNGVKDLGTWCVEHPLALITVAGVAMSIGDKTYKMAKLRSEDVRRKRTFYDPRKGRYTQARRDLTAYELEELDARYDRGESYNHILLDMGLLK